MTEIARQLWSRLHAAGIVAPADAPASTQVPWFIHALLAVSGWFAAVFLLSFFGALLSGLFRNEGALIAIGAVCCVAALGLLRLARDAVFLGQFAMPFSLAGQVMLALGVAQSVSSFSTTAAALCLQVVGAAMALLSAHAVHRFAATGMALVGVFVLLVEHEAMALAPPLFAAAVLAWWSGAREALGPAQYAAWRPAMHALNLALLGAVWFVGQPLWYEPAPTQWWIAWIAVIDGPLLAMLWMIAVALLWRRFRPDLIQRGAWLAALAALLLALLLWPAPGILATGMLMLLGFAAAERTVVATGGIGLLVYLSRYYYQLDIDLMAKSGVLVGSGLALLALRMLPRWLERSR
jgi:hypothetical protein